MKKFLTVLLALSVVFTYTVGTAFALPSEGNEQGGLPTAKAEAVETLNSYLDDINDLTEVGQKLMEAKVLAYKGQIDKAEKIGDVTNIMAGAKTALDKIKNAYGKRAVKDARDAAYAQLDDYLYLFGLEVDATTHKLTGYNVANGNIDLDELNLDNDWNKFVTEYNNQLKKFAVANSTDDVADTLNASIELIDKYMNKLAYAEVPESDVKDLVDTIIAYAGKKDIATGDKGTDHSSTVVKQYDEIVKEAVNAAKNVKTWKEYYDVVNEYLGTSHAKSAVKTADKDGYAVVTKQGFVYICEYNVGELNRLSNLDKNAEMRIKVATKVLAALGDYDYKEIANIDDTRYWATAEAFRARLADFIESADEADLVVNSNLYSKVIAVKATSSPSDLNTAVNELVAMYANYTKLAADKKDAVNEIKNFYGYDMDGANIAKANLDATYAKTAENNVQGQIADLQIKYMQLVNASATIADVEKYVAAYRAKVDAYKTIKEQTIEKKYSDIAASIDKVVADAAAETTLSADQIAFRDRLVADLKADIKAGEYYNQVKNWQLGATQKQKDDSIKTEWMVADGNGDRVKSLGDRLASLLNYNDAYTGQNFFGYVITPNKSDYTDAELKKVEYAQEKLKEAAAVKDQTWEGYFDAYDFWTAEATKVTTVWETNYADAVAKAEATIAALGTVENSYKFEAKLNAAKDAVEAVKTAKAGLANIMTDKEVYEVAGVSNIGAYLDAVYELAHLKYLAGIEEKDTTLPFVVRAYNDIAKAITVTTFLNANYDSAAREEILSIVTTAFDAIDAATTNDAKAVIAEKAITDLKAVANAIDDSDYTEALAANKTEAVKYFNKYYNANFTTEAATATRLIDEILAFNKQFHQSVIDAKAELIKDIKGTHMKIGSSAAKGYIRISWKQSNSTVALDGVKVYRSTKKTSGFKLISTFKKQTAKKYTANLKKGTKYYYKVKGYKVIDGVTYYTHESITVGRTFR